MSNWLIFLDNHIGGVRVSMLTSGAVMLTSSVVDCGFEPDWVKPKPINLVFVASKLSMQY